MSQVDAWRRVILDRLAQLVAICLCIIAVLVLGNERVRAGLGWGGAAVFVASALAITVLAVKKDGHFVVKAWVLLLATVVPSLVSIKGVGFLLPIPFLGLLSPPVFAALLFGRRAAFFVWGSLVVALSVLAVLFATEVLTPVEIPSTSRLAAWVRIIALYCVVGVPMVLSVSYLIDRLLQQVRETGALNNALVEKSHLLKEEETTRRSVEARATQNQKLEALGALAGGVAHDFNNLLTVVLASIDLAHTASDADRSGLLAEAAEAAQRGAILTRDLLAFSRQQVTVQTQSSLAQAVLTSLRLVKRLIPENIRVEATEMDESLQVMLGPVEIDQIVLNLCINARDAMPSKGGSIQVRVQRRPAPKGMAASGDVALLSIKDDGAGMDAGQRARVFEPFFTTKSTGTGLGMSVVHGVVNQLSGTIELDSELGKGSEFRIYLPLSVAPNVAPQPIPVAERSNVNSAVKVLVVDDELAIRVIVSRILRSAGYEVEACEDGQQALLVLEKRAHEFALIITDAIMPNMGGRELHDRVASIRPDMRFLFCSGYASETLEASVLDKPGRDFIPKPFTAAEMLARVAKMITSEKRELARSSETHGKNRG